MKKSIAYLPKRRQDDLYTLVRMILKVIPETQMIILYGSYARNEYVEYDERMEFGVPTSYMSDYDIIVVTHKAKDPVVIKQLDSIEDEYNKISDYIPPVQFINEDLDKLNNYLSEGRYFYTEIKQEGILLYDSGKYKLTRRRKLRYDEIKQQAQEYLEKRYHRATSFYRDAKYACQFDDYNQASFYLHQVCENLFVATRLVFTLQSRKQHNLAKLLASVRKYSKGFYELFPLHDKEVKRLFELLKASYVEARYNPEFIVTREDAEALIIIAQRLLELVKQVCDEQIEKYNALAKE